MTGDLIRLSNVLAAWLEDAGLADEVGSLCSCVIDVPQGADRVIGELVPSLVKCRAAVVNLAADLIADLALELEHIADHATEAAASARRALKANGL